MSAKSPIFTGNLTNPLTAMTLIPGARFRQNEFGTDVWDVPYSVPTAHHASRLPAKYSTLSIGGVSFPKMYLVSRQLEHSEALMSQWTLTYKGLGFVGTFSDQTNERSSTGKSLQSLETDVVVTNDVRFSVQLQYYAHQTTWRWIETRRPNYNSPRFQSTLSNADPWNDVFAIVIKIQDGREVTGPLENGILNVVKSRYKARKRISNYTVNEVIPGRFWECESTITIMLDR